MNETKFTVIVPTRERADTLRYCLQTITHQKYDNLQILVSDNFSGDDTEQIVKGVSDSRIRYINTGRRLGMSRNFEFAMSHVTDGWVTYLGDDDGLVPGALQVVNDVIRNTGVKAISSRWHHYTWPNFAGTTPPNRLTVKLGKGYQVRDCRNALQQVLKGRLNYFELPGIYIGGFVDFETLNRLKDESGRFFRSKVPDIYAAVALASALERYVFINQPLSVCGASSHSIGASEFGHSTNASAVAKYISEEDIPFLPSLGDGRVRSIQLLVYEAYLQALHLHRHDEGTSLPQQLALSIANAAEATPDVRIYCEKIANSRGIDFKSVEASARRTAFRRKWHTLWQRLKNPFSEFQVDGATLGAMNIFDASLASHSLYFQETLNRNWRIAKTMSALRRRL